MTQLKNTLTSCPQSNLRLIGDITVPGDKSISHRSMIIASLAEGVSEVSGFLEAADCLATMKAMQSMGVKIEKIDEKYVINGVGKHGLQAPSTGLIDCGNSGTGMRLLSGVLAAQPFSSTLSGDDSLNVRPMNRISKPLMQMGAEVQTTANGTAPIKFSPVERLTAIDYESPVASAQVKSCVLLAGLYCQQTTTLSEPRLSRDHTENMLRGFGVEVISDGRTVSMSGEQALQATKVVVPADISSAAFFMVLAALTPGAHVTFNNVCINSTRTGVIEILKMMGADITFNNQQTIAGERIADIIVKSSQLNGVVIPEKHIASAIDEFPVLFVAASLAKGQTVLRNAEELRKKESDRIAVMAQGLKKMGINCQEFDDGISIDGGQLNGAEVDAHDDHRCAMSFLIAGQCAQQPVVVKNCENIITSFPNFLEIAENLGLSVS